LDLLKEMESGIINREAAQEEVEKFWIGALKKAAIDGDVKNGSLMAGQSVGLVDKIVSVPELIEELISEGSKELGVLRSRIS